MFELDWISLNLDHYRLKVVQFRSKFKSILYSLTLSKFVYRTFPNVVLHFLCPLILLIFAPCVSNIWVQTKRQFGGVNSSILAYYRQYLWHESWKLVCLWRLTELLFDVHFILFCCWSGCRESSRAEIQRCVFATGKLRPLFLSWMELETWDIVSDFTFYKMKTWNVTQDISHFTQSFRFRPGCRSLSAVSLKNGHKSENFTFCQHRPFKYFRLDIWMKWKLGQVCGLMCSVTHAFCHFFCGTSSLRPQHPPSYVETKTTPLLLEVISEIWVLLKAPNWRCREYFVLGKLGSFVLLKVQLTEGGLKGYERVWCLENVNAGWVKLWAKSLVTYSMCT